MLIYPNITINNFFSSFINIFCLIFFNQYGKKQTCTYKPLFITCFFFYTNKSFFKITAALLFAEKNEYIVTNLIWQKLTSAQI